MACHKMTATSFLKPNAGKQSKNPDKKNKSQKEALLYSYLLLRLYVL